MEHQILSRGAAAGSYQAFPDICRVRGGDLVCVFYAGYGHVSLPTPDWPRGGRICLVRSRDDGKTWSEPSVLYDDADDNRDPHIAPLKDGTLVCSFFSLKRSASGAPFDGIGVQLARSRDGGRTWEKDVAPVVRDWYCSAPVRQLKSGVCLLGVYREDGKEAYGGVLRSTDGGKTWSEPLPIGRGQGLPLDAETDVIELRDGVLFAALRSSKVHMHYATSLDQGLTWSKAFDIGFPGHAPHLYRVKSGEIVLTHRMPKTCAHVSRDDGRTWEGPFPIAENIGAYPSTVQLRDGSLLIVYYEEGAGSAVRAGRFRLSARGLEPV